MPSSIDVVDVCHLTIKQVNRKFRYWNCIHKPFADRAIDDGEDREVRRLFVRRARCSVPSLFTQRTCSPQIQIESLSVSAVAVPTESLKSLALSVNEQCDGAALDTVLTGGYLPLLEPAFSPRHHHCLVPLVLEGILAELAARGESLDNTGDREQADRRCSGQVRIFQ